MYTHCTVKYRLLTIAGGHTEDTVGGTLVIHHSPEAAVLYSDQEP